MSMIENNAKDEEGKPRMSDGQKDGLKGMYLVASKTRGCSDMFQNHERVVLT